MMLSKLDHIITHCEDILNGTDSLTEEQHTFTEIIRENAHRLHEMLASVIVALEDHQPGDPFPGDIHDMRTPLVSILGYSDLMAAGVVGEVSEAQQTCFLDIHRLGSDLSYEMEHTYRQIKAQVEE